MPGARASRLQILLTEVFEESLALFMHMFNWDPIDMTYCR